MEYTKYDLDLYNLVETRNGSKYILLWKNEIVLLNINNAKILLLDNYDYLLFYEENEDFDIMKIKVFAIWSDVFRATGMCLDYSPSDIDWTWQRSEESVEITLKELNRLLGFRVKIVE